MWNWIKSFLGYGQKSSATSHVITLNISDKFTFVPQTPSTETPQNNNNNNINKRTRSIVTNATDVTDAPQTKRQRLVEAQEARQVLHDKLLALREVSRDQKKGLNLSKCSNILQPLVHPNKGDAWLPDDLISDYVHQQIAKFHQEKNIVVYPYHPNDEHSKRKQERFAKKHGQATKIIWPVLNMGSIQHYYLLLIGYEKEENRVYISCLDGYNLKDDHQELLQKAKELADLFYSEADVQMRAPEKVMHQGNGNDCGVVACFFADHFIQKSPSDFIAWLQTTPAPSDLENPEMPYTPYRAQIAQVICDSAREALDAADKPRHVELNNDSQIQQTPKLSA